MHAPPAPLVMASLDGLGSFVFALSGAVLAVQKRFDIFGVLVLAVVVAVAGGITRDVLIGAVPPAAITNGRDFSLAIAAGLLTFYVYPVVKSVQRDVLLLDAVGLAVFAVTGTEKALTYGIHPGMAAVLGMISGIGGGVVRDVLAREVPAVLRADIYALAALAAAGIVAIGHVLGITPLYPMLLGAAVCIFLRMMAIYRGWHAPVARWGGGEDQ
ncbi:MAG: trimeric intracellular cation channel family protein [Acetobacteraceae bacterium]